MAVKLAVCVVEYFSISSEKARRVWRRFLFNNKPAARNLFTILRIIEFEENLTPAAA